MKIVFIYLFRCALISLLHFMVTTCMAQNALDRYIREGLSNNLVIQQKNFTLEQAQQSLQIAQRAFLPSVTLLGDYLSAEGGRSINIPVGDLLNPVYSTLNELTDSHSFPQIDNVKQNFLPHNFYDARVRTSMPLVNTDLYANRTIRKQQAIMKQQELDVYKRQLIAEIKTSYFNYFMAAQAVKIYESAQLLVNRNVVINESLLEHGKALPASYLRSKSEAEKVAAELNIALNKQANARKYFNFLLNKPLDADIEAMPETGDTLAADTSAVSTADREELKVLQTAQAIHTSVLRMSKLHRMPRVNAFIDLGSQAYDWKYNDQSRYYLFGVQLSLPLFEGFRNRLLIEQNNIEIQKTNLDLSHTRHHLQMAAEIASNDAASARRNFAASGEQLKSAQSYFNLVERGYRQGVNSLIEFLDARNQLTASQLQRSLRKFEMLNALVRLERETASYQF